MGEVVGLRIGNYDFLSYKNTFGDLLSIFSKQDLKIEEVFDGELQENITKRYFTTTVGKAKMCLDVMGHTILMAKQLFKNHKKNYMDYIDEYPDDKIDIESIEKNYTFEMWSQAVIKYSTILATDIIPIRVEYDFCLKNHEMKAIAEHLESERKFSFLFDEKVVSERIVSSGDLLSDDDCIRDLVENYCKDHTGTYADLLMRHSDKVHLVSKTLDFVIENFGINLQTHVTVEKEKYFFKVNENNGDDVISGSFRAANFSEVLEKVRIFTSILGEVSKRFSENIDELSNDKVEEWIKWE